MMGSLILNTDQNRQEFFTQLQTYIKAKVEKKKDKFDMDNIFTIIYPVNFNALDKFFLCTLLCGNFPYLKPSGNESEFFKHL